ncbi:MAG: TonB-dependent receptor [Pseudomonadota bacterium]
MKHHTLAVLLVCAGAVAATEPDNSTELDRLMIEARLFDEPAIEVPGSVAVAAVEDVVAPVSPDLGDITADVPNVLFQQTNADERVVLRGISAYPNALADPVGVLVNGVALPLGTIQAPTLFALDQATVLSGPQGAHYGRNSEAGLISLNFMAPGAEQVSRLSAGVASDNTYTAGALFNTEADAVGLVFAADALQTQGALRNTATGDTQGGEGERLTVYTGAAVETATGTRAQLTHVHEREDSGKEQFRYADGAFATPRFRSNYSDRSDEERVIDVTSLDIRRDFADMAFTSITGATGFERRFALDFDTSPLTLGVTDLDLKDDMLSQEFRLASTETDGNTLQWSAGVSYYQQDTDVSFNLGAFNTARDTRIDQSGTALFGFAEYPVTARLRLGAGARLDRNRSDGTQEFSSPMLTTGYTASLSSNEFLPKATLAFDVDQNTLVYGSLARGYLAGGYNYNFANSGETFTFDPEFTDTAEVGVRLTWLDTTLDAAVFYAAVTDKQIVEVVPGGAQRIDNAADVDVYGAEAKLDHRLSDRWSLRAKIGVQSAEATDYTSTVFNGTALANVDYSGNSLPFSPEFSGALQLSYTSARWSGSVRINATGRYYFDAANSLEQDAFETLDLQLGTRVRGVDVSIWATNLFDTEYVTAALNTPRGQLVEDGAGRAVGLTASLDW